MAYSELEKLADRCESVELITGNKLKTDSGLGVFDLIGFCLDSTSSSFADDSHSRGFSRRSRIIFFKSHVLESKNLERDNSV
jgi:hypothetical protein